MRIEETIGQRVRSRREELGLSQAQLGRKVSGALGREWPRQAVSAAEAGRRAFTAAELLALAISLQVPVTVLLAPGADVRDVELGPGALHSRDTVVSAVVPRPDGMAAGVLLAEMENLAGRIHTRNGEARYALHQVAEDTVALADRLMKVIESVSAAEAAG